ncbi:hypothetical protein [Polyangium sp. y55x31]|uniref:hypothetical protein n=1 Tax=Polyangium sp. y55x31 TaxID=3042688 RepID=UPI00248312ED|nr:hypothetical protein [Polyangium sp. y55x31]MDI1476826.1 hypothetical protein [Polyangium sp. y55x31]
MNSLKTLYEPRVLSLRAEVENDHVLGEILAEDASPVLVECFLLEWFARTPYLTQPTARWSRRAAEQCDALGLHDVAHSFREHAAQEEVRASLVLRDARAVAQIVCMRCGISIDVAMLAERPTVVMRAYRVLNEEVLGADLLLGYAAIQYEIERVTSALAVGLLIQSQRVLGAEMAERLTWLRKRSSVGVERAALYATTLETILDQMPDAAEQLAEIGAGALDIYRHFLRECVQAAHASARAITGERSSSSPRSSQPELCH